MSIIEAIRDLKARGPEGDALSVRADGHPRWQCTAFIQQAEDSRSTPGAAASLRQVRRRGLVRHVPMELRGDAHPDRCVCGAVRPRFRSHGCLRRYRQLARWRRWLSPLRAASRGAGCQAAGGVDGFVIGSEMIGLTRLRDGSAAFPFVDALMASPMMSRTMLGPDDADLRRRLERVFRLPAR
jgi:hypothetical protein